MSETTVPVLSAPRRSGFPAPVATVVRIAGAIVLPLIVFGVLLLAFGKDPIKAYIDIFKATLGGTYGLSEVLVKMIPLVLCATAVLLPARIGLVNVGGEGQLYLGAWLATWGALTFSNLPAPWSVLLAIALAFVGGGLWAAIPGFLRARGWLNETIATLLLNYVAVLFVGFFIFGAWKDPKSANFPQTVPFEPAWRLVQFAGTRVHLGLILAIIVIVALAFVLKRTRWGLEMRAIGGNAEAALRKGIPISRYLVLVMFVAGGLAGLAGMGEVMAIQGRLRPGISPSYGYIGFLISWLAGHNPWVVVVMAFLMSVITLGGDTLQITQSMPFATVNILMATTLFIVLGGFFKRKRDA